MSHHRFPWSLLARAARSDRGASLVEYAFLVALIAVACIAAMAFMGEETNERFSVVGDSVAVAGS